MTPQDMAMERQDLQRMLEQARDLMRAGARGAAQDLLNQLRNMLENMRAGVMEQPSGQQTQANRMMRDLRDLAQRQQQLMDQTFRQAQQGKAQQAASSRAINPARTALKAAQAPRRKRPFAAAWKSS